MISGFLAFYTFDIRKVYLSFGKVIQWIYKNLQISMINDNFLTKNKIMLCDW